MPARLTDVERRRIYGQPGQVTRSVVTLPWGMRAQVHDAAKDVFLTACAAADKASPWKPKRVDSFAVRQVRGSTTTSLHSYALAWDIFATGPTVPPPGGVWTPDNGVPAAFAAEFVSRGFTWGATWDRQDVPHIEWAGGLPVNGGSPAPPAAGTLKLGSKGVEVKQLQERLNTAAKSGLKADGDYGPATERAVRVFQAAQGLTVDGQAGPMTRARLAVLVGAAKPSQPLFPVRHPDPKDDNMPTAEEIARAVWEHQFEGYPMQNHLHATTVRVERLDANDIGGRIDQLRQRIDQRFDEAHASLAADVSPDQVVEGVRTVLRSALE